MNERAKQILAQLEAEHLDDRGRPRIGAGRSKPQRGDIQLTLFAPIEHPLLDSIRGIDVNRLTPLEALQLLQKWQDELTKPTDLSSLSRRVPGKHTARPVSEPAWKLLAASVNRTHPRRSYSSSNSSSSASSSCQARRIWKRLLYWSVQTRISGPGCATGTAAAATSAEFKNRLVIGHQQPLGG